MSRSNRPLLVGCDYSMPQYAAEGSGADPKVRWFHAGFTMDPYNCDRSDFGALCHSANQASLLGIERKVERVIGAQT